MENLFWKFFLPNWSWARQPLSSARSTLLYPFQMLSAKQGSSNSHLLTSFGMTRPGIEPTTSRLWGGRSTDWANTHRAYQNSIELFIPIVHALCNNLAVSRNILRRKWQPPIEADYGWDTAKQEFFIWLYFP